MSDLRENLKIIGFSDDLLDKMINKHSCIKFEHKEIKFNAKYRDANNLIYTGENQRSSQIIIIK